MGDIYYRQQYVAGKGLIPISPSRITGLSGLQINTRKKIFISHHHQNRDEILSLAEKYWGDYQDHCILRSLGLEDDYRINSSETEYVMRCIREKFIQDSTVTVVMIGRCTYARKYVDWEIQASLKSFLGSTNSGLVGILLPSSLANPVIPKRLLENVNSGYAKIYPFPYSSYAFSNIINEAYNNRTVKAHLINNPIKKMQINLPCL